MHLLRHCHNVLTIVHADYLAVPIVVSAPLETERAFEKVEEGTDIHPSCTMARNSVSEDAIANLHLFTVQTLHRNHWHSHNFGMQADQVSNAIVLQVFQSSSQ